MIKKIFILFLLVLAITSFKVQLLSAGQIPILEWNELSDKDISPDAKLAFSSNKNSWEHAQSEHFIYHFTDQKDAETIYNSAEVYYKWVKETLDIKEDTWVKKCHIFIFSDENTWEEFRAKAWSKQTGDALTNGWELFMYRKPYYLSPKRSLAHEITHIVVFRFFEGPLPLALNEGLAEFISYRSLARQLGKNEYDIWTIQLIAEQDFIPLSELIEMRSFPKEKISVSYQESELLIRFLIFKYDKRMFYNLCKEVSRGKPFKDAIEEIYKIDYQEFQEKFRDYATK
ncbi:MAG: hypothetical protein AB1472_04905 [Candidatus Omnitrophota bacterium]